MAKYIQVPFGSGKFTIKTFGLHTFTQADNIKFFSSGPIMGFAFEGLAQNEYPGNITTVRVKCQKKDLVIQDPDDPTCSRHWEAKGFKTSESDCAGKTQIFTDQVYVDIGASSETGSGRKADIGKSLRKMDELAGYILHIPGTFPDIYHYQLPIEIIRFHRLSGKLISLSTVIEELRAAGVKPFIPTRVRDIPVTHRPSGKPLYRRASTCPTTQAA